MYTTYSTLTTAASIVAMLGGGYATTEISALEVVHVMTAANHVEKVKTDAFPSVVWRADSHIIGSTAKPPLPLHEPKTALGRKLLELREKALASGMTLLTVEEVNARVKDMRGDNA